MYNMVRMAASVWKVTLMCNRRAYTRAHALDCEERSLKFNFTVRLQYCFNCTQSLIVCPAYNLITLLLLRLAMNMICVKFA